MGRELNVAARAMRSQLDAGLKRAGISFATWRVLQALDLEGAVIQRALADALEIEGPTLVRRLDQLEAKGLVARSPSPTDRRATEVALTDKGRGLFDRVRAAMAEMEVTLLAGLERQDIDTTLRVLRLLIERCRGRS
jgi:MarR family transcriptional regulator for hemolysin